MKKFLLSAALMCGSVAAFAQLVDVASTTRVPLPENVRVSTATISPDGKFFVASDPSGSGIAKIDVATGNQTVVARNASSFDVSISDDCENIMFRRITTKNNLRYTSLHSVNVATGNETELVAPSRHISGYRFSGKTALAINDSRLKQRNLEETAVALNDIVVGIDYGHLVGRISGETKTLDPQGRASYLWPALSPDKTKIVYWVAFKGCYVCNIDGSNPVHLGELRAAKWLGNDMVVGMNDRDNGEFVTSSSIIVSDLAGTKQVVTDSDKIAMFPSTTADGKHIAYVDANGELFVINLK